MALIDLIDVSKKFGANEILNNISLSVNENEKIAIIGKNGQRQEHAYEDHLWRGGSR